MFGDLLGDVLIIIAFAIIKKGVLAMAIRRRGRSLVKNVTLNINCLDLVSGYRIAQAKYVISTFNSKGRHQKISHCGSPSPNYVRISYFTLMSCRGCQRNVQKFRTHVQRHCAH